MKRGQFVPIDENAHVKNYFDMLSVLTPPKLVERQESQKESYVVSEKKRVNNFSEFTKRLKE